MKNMPRKTGKSLSSCCCPCARPIPLVIPVHATCACPVCFLCTGPWVSNALLVHVTCACLSVVTLYPRRYCTTKIFSAMTWITILTQAWALKGRNHLAFPSLWSNWKYFKVFMTFLEALKIIITMFEKKFFFLNATQLEK